MATEMPIEVLNVPTPSFLVDIDKLERNARAMQDRCKHLGIQLRPHTKTHKTIEAADILCGGQKRCIAVSTLAEADLYSDNGFDDILFAFVITENKIVRCRQLHNKIGAFHVMLDSKVGYEALEKSPTGNGKPWSVYIEIDVKYHRTGVSWQSDDIVNLASLISGNNGMTFRGLYCHNGDTYNYIGSEAIKEAGRESTEILMKVKQRLLQHSINCGVVCMGSTPSCSHPDESMSLLEEFSPGNYVFYDVMQKNIGSCSMDDIAGRVATRVISQNVDHNILIIDCGFLAISKDGMENNLPKSPWIIQDNPNLRLVGMSQELGKVTTVEGKVDFAKYPIGTMLFIYPYHSCATAAMHPVYYVHSGDKIMAMWRPIRGW
ncbi:D-serine dehydratase-like [Ylistrum balloti]|uniref:D-serine dehydratase-like n=1 Tax=Ylistrum balloti TaxID=509963 RepID=UPI002905EC27|nr:D-serine dehydratase-like [Ylistrum balloti]